MPLTMRSNTEGVLTQDNRIKSCGDKTCGYYAERYCVRYIKLPMTPELRTIILRDAPADFSFMRYSEYLELSVQANREHHRFLLINTAPMLKGRSVNHKTYYTMFDSAEFSVFVEQSKKFITTLLEYTKNARIEQIRTNTDTNSTLDFLRPSIGSNIDFTTNNSWMTEHNFLLSNNEIDALIQQRDLALVTPINTSMPTSEPELPPLPEPAFSYTSAQSITAEDIANAQRALSRTLTRVSESSTVQELLRRTQVAYEPAEVAFDNSFGLSRPRPDRRPVQREPENDMFSYLESGRI